MNLGKIFTKETVNKVGVGAKKNAPTLMLIGATIGFGLTIYEAMKAKPKIDDILEKRKARIEEIGDGEGKEDEVKKANIEAGVDLVKVVSKPAVTGACTVGLMWGANYIHMKRIASLSKKLADATALYDISQEALKKYKISTKEVVGEKKEEEISKKADQRLVDDTYNASKVLNCGQGDQLFLDKKTGRYFRSTLAQIENGVADLRLYFDYGEFIEANRLYENWGLDECEFGEENGWMPGQIELWVSTRNTAKTPDGHSCIVLEYDTIPCPRYE